MKMKYLGTKSFEQECMYDLKILPSDRNGHIFLISLFETYSLVKSVEDGQEKLSF